MTQKAEEVPGKFSLKFLGQSCLLVSQNVPPGVQIAQGLQFKLDLSPSWRCQERPCSLLITFSQRKFWLSPKALGFYLEAKVTNFSTVSAPTAAEQRAKEQMSAFSQPDKCFDS